MNSVVIAWILGLSQDSSIRWGSGYFAGYGSCRTLASLKVQSPKEGDKLYKRKYELFFLDQVYRFGES